MAFHDGDHKEAIVDERTEREVRRKLDKKPEHTPRQRQFLAFVHYDAKLNGCPPAEGDMARYLRITPPSAHQMVVTLEQRGLIERVPGQGRLARPACSYSRCRAA